MNYTMNMSQKERIFLDSSVIIGLFSGDDDAEKILGRIIIFTENFLSFQMNLNIKIKYLL